jgi:hypothetical protein
MRLSSLCQGWREAEKERESKQALHSFLGKDLARVFKQDTLVQSIQQRIQHNEGRKRKRERQERESEKIGRPPRWREGVAGMRWRRMRLPAPGMVDGFDGPFTSPASLSMPDLP